MFNKVAMVSLIMFASTGIVFAESIPNTESSVSNVKAAQDIKLLSGENTPTPEDNALAADISDTATNQAAAESSTNLADVKG